ncbi:MAG: hypothetical protein AAF196_07295 [Planctomycetota bacterium]
MTHQGGDEGDLDCLLLGVGHDRADVSGDELAALLEEAGAHHALEVVEGRDDPPPQFVGGRNRDGILSFFVELPDLLRESIGLLVDPECSRLLRLELH